MSDSRAASGGAAVAADPLLDVEALTGWMGETLGDGPVPVRASRIGATTGVANALYELRRGDDVFVLRRPPLVLNDKSAGDMKREWRILEALDGTPVPHPATRLLCEDPSVIGSMFFIMDKIDGFTPGFELQEPFLSDPSLRRGLAEAYVDGLVELAAVDWRVRGLEGLGKPEGFLERQVSRWLAQLDRYRTRDLPELDFVTDWLEGNRPEMSPAGIIHGDYSPFNVMIAPEPPARLAAIIDWDTGTIGDPLLDIGHLLARWTNPGEDPVIDVQAGGVDHYPTRAELATRYAERSGRDLSALPYYQCLALFKLAVILEGRVARATTEGVPDAENPMMPIVEKLMVGAADFARGKRV